MDEFKVLLKAIVDVKDTQAQLNAIKNLSVKIEKLNLDQSAITELRNQLSKNGIDINLVLGNTSQIQNQARQTGQQIGKIVSDSAERAITGVSSKGIDRYFRIDPSTSREFEREMKQLVNQWTNAKGQMTDLKIDTRTVYDKDANASFERLHQATVTYKNDLDEVTKKTIAWRQIGTTTDTKGNEVAIRGFVEVAGQYSKALEKASIAADTFADKQTRLKSSLSDSLNSIKSSVADQNASKPIKDQTNISSLQSQYQIVEQAIVNVGSASKSNFAQMEADARTQISVLIDMVRQYRNAENVATSLRTKDFSTVKDVQVQNLQAFKDKIEGSNVPITKMQTELSSLDIALNNAFDAESLTSYLNQMDVVQAKFKQMSAEITSSNRNEKVGINVSGLESKITDIQRISPEINNFKTQINGAEVSVESLLADLSNVNSQGDFSVINTKFKAFADSAKASGIAITELVTSSKKIDKIQLSVDNGTTSTQIDTLRTKFEKLGFTQDEISQKMKSVLDSHNALKSSLSGGNNTAIVSANDKFNQSLKETENLYKQIKADSTQYYNTTKQTKLSNDIQNWMSKNSAATKQAKASLQQFLAELNNGRVNVARLDEIRANFQSIDTQMRSVGKLGKSFTQTFSEGIKKFSYWTSSTFLVMKTIQEIKQAVTSVKELDTALVDLKKTTKATNSELENFYHNSNSVAKSLGVSTREVIQATADWSRLGYTIKEAQTLAETSAILSSISPGMSIDTSTETLVSTLKAYGIEAEDALDGVASKINIIGNNLALSNNDIAEILKRSASAMNSANTGLEKTIALGSAAQAIVQDSAVVGTALKSVSTRIRGLDEETEQLSEDLVNIKGDVYDLTNQKVSIMIDNDTYKDIYTILDEISQVWDELTDKQHADLLSTLFGTRQTNVGAAILSNFDDARKAMNLFQESSGNAMAEMNIIYDSLDYKMNRLKETGTGIAQNLFGRDEMKSVVDALTKVAETIDFVTDKLGLLGTIGLGAGLFTGIKNVGIA